MIIAGGKKEKKNETNTFKEDFAALCDMARQEEEEGSHVTDCKVKIGSTIVYAHRSFLVARSNFFKKAFTQKLSESHTGTVELKHVSQDLPRAALHTLLRFMYTGDTGPICSETAWAVLELLGAEDGDFLEIKDSTILRAACEKAVMEALGKDDIPMALQRGHALGTAATGLKKTLMEHLIASLRNLHDNNALNQIIQTPELMGELLNMVGTCLVPKPGWKPKNHLGKFPCPDSDWKLILSSHHAGLANSAAALRNTDWTTGAGTAYTGGEFIQSSFDCPVLVSAVHLGIGHMHQGWSHSHLNGATIEHSDDATTWTPVTRIVSAPTVDSIHINQLPEPTVAQHWRFVKPDHDIGISYLLFE